MRWRIAWKHFGQTVQNAREAREMGLRELARYLRISHSAACRIEQGKPVEPATFVSVCDWLGVEPKDYLAPLYTKRK